MDTTRFGVGSNQSSARSLPRLMEPTRKMTTAGGLIHRKADYVPATLRTERTVIETAPLVTGAPERPPTLLRIDIDIDKGGGLPAVLSGLCRAERNGWSLMRGNVFDRVKHSQAGRAMRGKRHERHLADRRLAVLDGGRMGGYP